CNTTLKKLDSIHNTALRIATGAFRTSPILSVLEEANEPPLSFRRKLLSTSQAIKISTTPDKPVYLKTFPTNCLITKYTKKKHSSKPYYYRIHTYEEELNTKLTSTIPRRLPTIPPWTIQPIETNTELLLHAKGNTNPEIYRSSMAKILNNHKDYILIYTDGSKSESGTGYAVVTPESIVRIKLSNATSVLSAELMGINHAFKIAHEKSYQRTAIFTDSYSAIATLNNKITNNDTILNIIEIYQKITCKGNKIKIIWIPSHVGIPGNERADQIAKEATTLTPPNDDQNLHMEDMIKTIKSQLTQQWETTWKQTAPLHITNITEKFFNNYQMTSTLPRRDQVAITRIRIGHSRYTNSYLLTKEPPPQ
ncbi:uncharacterized protein LOC144478042, partial [Augochlora pura]